MSHQTPPLPPTQKQIVYARQIAMRSNIVLPWSVLQERRSLSRWIEEQQANTAPRYDADLPTSKQVQFAEQLARFRRVQIPDECFRSRALLSRWIDSNKH